jgi:hypothetical protein
MPYKMTSSTRKHFMSTIKIYDLNSFEVIRSEEMDKILFGTLGGFTVGLCRVRLGTAGAFRLGGGGVGEEGTG